MELIGTSRRAATARVAPLAEAYRRVRNATLGLVAGLSPEDLAVQSMPDASPGKWHLAHTSWFFDAVALAAVPGRAPLRPDWHALFNSYYESLGPRHPRPQRGLLTRPSLDEIHRYREHVDAALSALLSAGAGEEAR
ncbi:MAG TPA: DinB family protein, partial [Xanthomonadales bacterium]|nr:DinB family protein [Xanthomonadales bacterium]